MINAIYNKDVLRLAANISRIKPIANADISITRRSPLCGSTITVSLKLEKEMVIDYSHEIKACALGQASAAVLAKHVIGNSSQKILWVRGQLETMLASDGPVPEGEWADLSSLQPAKDAKPRHGAILLPFDAVLQGLSEVSM